MKIKKILKVIGKKMKGMQKEHGAKSAVTPVKSAVETVLGKKKSKRTMMEY